jgi:2-polyprenyl-3-methyl-5-hydroxy-6-metoxy-1,4-benzoquinol methylase
MSIENDKAGSCLIRSSIIQNIKKPDRIPANLAWKLHEVLFSFKKRELSRKQILEISKYTKQPFEQVASLFYNTNLPNEAWLEVNPKTETEILQFYATTVSLIYSNMRHNVESYAKYNSRFILSDFCKRRQFREILDYGASTGEYCIFLAQQGFKVSYCDVYGETWNFARWRFRSRNLSINMLKPEDEPSGKFDLIVCAEVLEHIRDPPSLLKKFCDELKPRGILAATWNFGEPASQHLRENEKYTATMSEILQGIGFRKVCENYFQFLEKCRE